MLVGNDSVGKTSIATKYIEGKFISEHKPTIGLSYFRKDFAFPDGSTLRLHIWDTERPEKLRSAGLQPYNSAHAAFVVYAIDDEDSFFDLDSLIKKHLNQHGKSPR